MQLLASALLLTALPFGLAKGDGKTLEVASMPGCTQFMTVDGATVPACAIETVTQDTTVTSLRHTAASVGVAGPSDGSNPAFTNDPVWTNSTTSAASTSASATPPSSGLETQPSPTHTISTKAHTPESKQHSSSHSSEPASSTHASSGFSLSSLFTGTTSNSFGPYTNSTGSFTIPHASFASGVLGAQDRGAVEVQRRPHVGLHEDCRFVTATVTLDGTEIETTSAVVTKISSKLSSSLPGVLSSVPAYGPPEVTKATSQKPSQPAKPTPSCTLAHNPHFGKCVLKDVGSKAKVNGTAALVTASGSPKIYRAICDCKKIPNVSSNHTMPVPVEVCGALMCPNEMASKPEQPSRPPLPSAPDAERSGFKTSPKPSQVIGSAAPAVSSIETSSKHLPSSYKSVPSDEASLSHTGTVTGRVTVNVPVPTNAISSATEAMKSSSSVRAESNVVESIWDSITSHAAEQASVTISV